MFFSTSLNDSLKNGYLSLKIFFIDAQVSNRKNQYKGWGPSIEQLNRKVS